VLLINSIELTIFWDRDCRAEKESTHGLVRQSARKFFPGQVLVKMLTLCRRAPIAHHTSHPRVAPTIAISVMFGSSLRSASLPGANLRQKGSFVQKSRSGDGENHQAEPAKV